MLKTNISILLSILIFSGCATLEPTLGPLDSNVIPKEWNTKIENNSTSNINEIKPTWENFVQNETLKRVVELAIKNNKDLKIAILNIYTARATYRVSK
ncbi:MAG: TolC family protein, partial [Sulfurimonadaceae bacterium]|nr:TolC family protein [Sulfurimonadaceae bacterium]